MKLKNETPKTALVVIDLQNYFVQDLERSKIARIVSLIEENNFNYVVFTKFINKKSSNFFRKLNWKKCANPAETNICEELFKFVTSKNVFEKNTYSVFKSKKFVDFLRNKKINKIFLCGVDVDACILASVFEGFDLGFDVEVLDKLSFSRSGREFEISANRIIEKNLKRR